MVLSSDIKGDGKHKVESNVISNSWETATRFTVIYKTVYCLLCKFEATENCQKILEISPS